MDEPCTQCGREFSGTRITSYNVCYTKLLRAIEHYLVIELILIKIPWIFYYPILEFLTQGQTLGKYLVGIRVVTYTGERPGLREVFIRWLFKGYFMWIGISFASFLGGIQVVQIGAIQLSIGLIGFFYASISQRIV